jgi:hypothetical protein
MLRRCKRASAGVLATPAAIKQEELEAEALVDAGILVHLRRSEHAAGRAGETAAFGPKEEYMVLAIC